MELHCTYPFRGDSWASGSATVSPLLAADIPVELWQVSFPGDIKSSSSERVCLVHTMPSFMIALAAAIEAFSFVEKEVGVSCLFFTSANNGLFRIIPHHSNCTHSVRWVDPWFFRTQTRERLTFFRKCRKKHIMWIKTSLLPRAMKGWKQFQLNLKTLWFYLSLLC